MQATQELPPGYTLERTLDFSTPAPVLVMNLIAIPLCFLAGWGFLALLRPALGSGGFWGEAGALNLGDCVFMAGLFIGLIVAHELVHGAFFWLFSGERPRFAFKGAYAYAAVPGWYFPKRQYLMVGIAPLVLLTLVGLLWMAVSAPKWIFMLVIVFAVHTAGCIGDLIVVGWLLFRGGELLVQDEGDRFKVYSIPAGTD
jgi:hypothetical protein